MAAQTAAEFVPDSHDLDELAEAAHGCKGCDLYLNATQTVFGAGSPKADIMLVGEQPGDQEDKAGVPFVGPAGRLLDKALDGGRRGPEPDVCHERGEALQVHASRTRKATHPQDAKPHRGGRMPAMADRGVGSVQPDVLMLLGATAAQSLMGSTFRLTAHRGEVLRLPDAHDLAFDPQVVVTAHPSSVLRGRPEDRDKAFDALVSDLRYAAGLLKS